MKFIMPELTHVFHTTVLGGPATLAAIVATDDLTVAFNSTNHVGDGRDWREFQNVLATGYSNRSTRVGDFMMQGDKLYSVDVFGFSHVNGFKGSTLHAVEKLGKWFTERRLLWTS